MNNQRNVSAGTGPPARRGALGGSQGAPQPLSGRDQGQRQGWRSLARGSTPLPTLASYTRQPSTGVGRKADSLGERGLPARERSHRLPEEGAEGGEQPACREPPAPRAQLAARLNTSRAFWSQTVWVQIPTPIYQLYHPGQVTVPLHVSVSSKILVKWG